VLSGNILHQGFQWQYNPGMKSAKNGAVLDELISRLGECLTPESARRLLALKADPTMQAHVDYLASRHTQGTLTPDEEAEYGQYVSYNTFVAILKSKARQLLAGTPR
jgi:hypothetical protein